MRVGTRGSPLALRQAQQAIEIFSSIDPDEEFEIKVISSAGDKDRKTPVDRFRSPGVFTGALESALAAGEVDVAVHSYKDLPTETADDIEAIIELINRVSSVGRQTGKRPQIRVSLATFVPKPHTPFQWVAQENEAQLTAKHELLKQGLRRRGIRLSWTDPKVSQLEAVLSRGDRRLGRVIHRAWQLGSSFDAWSEHFNYANWLRAFEEAGLEPAIYHQRERPLDEPLPWAHIDIGLTQAFLKREYQRALRGQETADCRYQACNVCGLQRWQPPCRQKHQELSQSRR